MVQLAVTMLSHQFFENVRPPPALTRWRSSRLRPSSNNTLCSAYGGVSGRAVNDNRAPNDGIDPVELRDGFNEIQRDTGAIYHKQLSVIEHSYFLKDAGGAAADAIANKMAARRGCCRAGDVAVHVHMEAVRAIAETGNHKTNV